MVSTQRKNSEAVCLISQMRSLDLYPYLAVDFSQPTKIFDRCFLNPPLFLSTVSPKKIPSFQNIETQRFDSVVSLANSNTRALLHLEWCLMFWVSIFTFQSMQFLISPSLFFVSQVFFWEFFFQITLNIKKFSQLSCCKTMLKSSISSV